MPPKKKDDSKGKKPMITSEKEPARKRKQKQMDLCVVVFSNGKCELFQSEDEARVQDNHCLKVW